MSQFLVVAYSFSLSLPITVPWVILTVGLICMFVHFLVLASQNKLRTEKNPFDAPLSKPIVIFALAVALSGAANGGMSEAFKSFQGLRGMLVYFWAYWAFSNNAKLTIWSVMAILIAGSLSGSWAAIQQLTGFHPFSFAYLQGTGFLSGPMAFSGLAQLFSLLALGIYLKGGYKEFPFWLNNKYAFGLVLAGNCLGLLFCSERSAWSGGVIALILISFLVSKRTAILTSLSLLATVVLGWLALPVVRSRLSALTNWQADVSVTSRFVLWDRAWQVFKESPIFGIGIRHFPHLKIEEALKQGHLALDHAHSNYFHILATTGIVGFCAYLYLWFASIKLAFLEQKDARYSILQQGIYLGILSGLISLAISGLFEYNFGTGQVRLAQWFLLAMLATSVYKTRL